MTALAFTASSAAAQPEIYRTDQFSITPTSVRQGRFEAVALSRDSIVSTYPRAGREMHFRFSLNGVDNEFPSGTEHTLYVRPRQGRIVSPVYVFGQEQPPFIPTPEATEGSEEGTARVTISLDLREVLRTMAREGSYDPPQGPPIRRGELTAVYAIGDVEPMSWDSRVLRPGSPAQLHDLDGDGIYTLELEVEAQYTRPQEASGHAVWRRTADISAFPALQSDQPMVDALYRMSLEELQQLVREDGALSAGAKWPGVWTRDVSYASVLALAMIAPDAVKRSLLAKVDSAGRIIQDTGTGGSWPISTDRMTWALAAWEVYAATGDRDWLRRAHDVIRRSAEADLHAAFEPGTGLVTGETSFMDWREQSYPRWMDPRDIAQSAAAGTNVVHFATYRILGDMARALGEPAERWDRTAASLREAINHHLWLERGWYASFRYGREFPVLTPRTDALAQSLAIIYGVAGQQRSVAIARSMPVAAFGPPTFWPYIPGIPHYHNGALWPFVSAFWSWAAADAGNTAAVEHGLASIYRPAALFLTNKENMVAATGHFDGTELNSDRQLWSVAGNLAASYRVLFGMRLQPDRLVFRPMVPPGYGGTRTLTGLRYRDATLAVIVRGHGNDVARVTVDGAPARLAEVPATLTGSHTVEIEMNGVWPSATIARVADRFSPATPRATLRGDTLRWEAVPNAVGYRVFRNGKMTDEVRGTTSIVERASAGLAEYQVAAFDTDRLESFLSEPIRVEGRPSFAVKPAGMLTTDGAGFTGAGYLRLTREENRELEVQVTAPCAGDYALDARYANGSGPINTDAKAAIRSVEVDGRPAGVLVMPQRGTDRWEEWGWSTSVPLRLTAGTHTVRLRFTSLDENMDGRVNTAHLDHLRLTLVEQHTRGVSRSACR